MCHKTMLKLMSILMTCVIELNAFIPVYAAEKHVEIATEEMTPKEEQIEEAETEFTEQKEIGQTEIETGTEFEDTGITEIIVSEMQESETENKIGIN